MSSLSVSVTGLYSSIQCDLRGVMRCCGTGTCGGCGSVACKCVACNQPQRQLIHTLRNSTRAPFCSNAVNGLNLGTSAPLVVGASSAIGCVASMGCASTTGCSRSSLRDDFLVTLGMLLASRCVASRQWR